PRDEPRDHRRLDMGYSRSKWAAEQLVVAAKARGVPARVYRLGLVTGASDTGACHLTNFVWNVIRVSVELGSLPDYDRVIDMAPVDWVARSLVRASLEAGDDTLHLVNLAPTSIFGLRRWLERRGYEMRVESFERWHVRLFQRVIATPSLSPLLPVLSLTSAEFYARAQVRYDRPEAGAFAEASGDACPPADDALLDTYLHYFRDRGFLPRPGERRPAPEARVALDGLRLRELVVEITGFPERDGERLHAPLTALLPEMRAQQYREDGLSRASTRLLLALIRRARIGELRRRHPEIAEIPVERPLIIAAPPRTGTTLLHNLLALEPSNHAFALWELMHPVNPTRAGASWAAHVQGVTAELIAETYERSPDLRAIHPLRAEAPDECSWLLSATATSLVNAVCAHAPGYAAWLLSTDMRPAYRFHREAVQALLWRRPGAQLVLKDPWHLWHLDALLDTYPDATVVLLHRDMRAVVPSLCSLTRALIAIEAAPPPDEVIGRRCLELLEQGITRMLRTRALLPGAFVDVDYRALVADPIGAARAIQEASGRALSPAGERAMRQWLIDNPPNAHGPHRYDLATFGLDPADVDARFAEYTARFLR
ncbi:MAG: sulfotransferase, partial [Myxococcales bacterium]|nr:sulfotransferase [Myxococcales bacterium]